MNGFKTTVEELALETLEKKQMTLTTVESCTGGRIASRIVSVPGASAVFRQGFVTYCDEAKIRFVGVRPGTIEKYTAVSAETASEMAEGAVRLTGTDCSVATTGFAGPDGGTEEYPVGTVFIAACCRGKTTVQKCMFTGNRSEIRTRAAVYALSLLCSLISEF